jgi:hypothetical protein
VRDNPIAIHEAGHAVAAAVLRVAFSYVELLDSPRWSVVDGVGGYTRGGVQFSGSNPLDACRPGDASDAAYAVRCAAVFVAGPRAANRADYVSDCGAQIDIERAKAIEKQLANHCAQGAQCSEVLAKVASTVCDTLGCAVSNAIRVHRPPNGAACDEHFWQKVILCLADTVISGRWGRIQEVAGALQSSRRVESHQVLSICDVNVGPQD